MKRYRIGELEPHSLEVGTVYLYDEEGLLGEIHVTGDFRGDVVGPALIEELSARRLRQLAAAPEMEKLLAEYHTSELFGSLGVCGCDLCHKRRKLFDYIETGEEG